MANLTFTSANVQCPTTVTAARDNARAARDCFVWKTEWCEAREPGVARKGDSGGKMEKLILCLSRNEIIMKPKRKARKIENEQLSKVDRGDGVEGEREDEDEVEGEREGQQKCD